IHAEQKEPLHVIEVLEHETYEARYKATGFPNEDIHNGMIDVVSLELMQNPMFLGNCGHSLDRKTIIDFEKNHSKKECPCCRKPITTLHPNINLKQTIENFVEQAEKRKKQTACQEGQTINNSAQTAS